MSSETPDLRLWRDPALGRSGTELMAARFAQHRFRGQIRDETVIAVLTGGALRFRIGREQGVAPAGSTLIVPAGEVFAGEPASGRGWSGRVFYPDHATLAGLMSETAAAIPLRAADTEAGPLYTDENLARRLAALHRAIEDNDANPQARQQAFAAAMTAVLVRCACAAGRPPPDNKAVRRALECVRARFADPALSVRDLAAAAGYSPYHFMRSFRAVVGMTAHEYVIQCRLRAARAMLADGVAAADVAHAAGFADQSHLIRQFRAALGVTPGQYTDQCRRRSAPPPAGVRPRT